MNSLRPTFNQALDRLQHHSRFARHEFRLQTQPAYREVEHGQAAVRFTVCPAPTERPLFRFWREYPPGELARIPGASSHSERSDWRRTFAIDRATDQPCYLSWLAIAAIYPPRGTTALEPMSFRNVRAPLNISGHSFEVVLNMQKFCTYGGIELTAELLACALGQDNRYVSFGDFA